MTGKLFHFLARRATPLPPLPVGVLLSIEQQTIEPPLAAGEEGVALLGKKGENLLVNLTYKCSQSGSVLFSVTRVLIGLSVD